MEIGLWSAQITLLFIYGAFGIYKLFWTSTAQQKMAWANDRSERYLRAVGIAEMLGGLGVVLPMLTGMLTWITPLAAVGLSVIQVMAISTVHIPRKEYKMLPLNLYFLAVSIFILIGRWPLLAVS